MLVFRSQQQVDLRDYINSDEHGEIYSFNSFIIKRFGRSTVSFSIQFDGEFVNGDLTWVCASNLNEIFLRHLTRSNQKFLVPHFPLVFCCKKTRNNRHALGKLKHTQLRVFSLRLNYAKYFDRWLMRSNVHPARGLIKNIARLACLD